MKCSEYKKWFIERDGEGSSHAQTCAECASLKRLDDALEQGLRNGLKEVDLPEWLEGRVEMNLESISTGRTSTAVRALKGLVPLAAAAVFAFFILARGGEFGSMEDLGRLAVESHVKGLSMEFKAADVANPSEWFKERLDFDVRLRAANGIKLLGGRKCSLGRNDVAYLFYEKDGRAVSTFIIDAQDLGFEMTGNSPYRMPVDGKEVSLMRDGQLVYATVE